MKLKQLLQSYRHMILYLIFGVGTTLVNVAVYSLCAHALELPTTASTCIAWILSVLFAYLTNRFWVFESRAGTVRAILREAWSFFACRLATGALDLAIMYVCVDVLGFHDVAVKLLSNVLVVILNYIASKLLVFSQKEK